MAIEHTDLSGADDVHVDVFHCASVHGTHEQQRHVIGRIESLVERGDVDRVQRQAWAHELVPEADDDWCEEARATYSRFWTWAREHERTLEPAFGTRTVSSMVSDDSYDVITFPVLCVAIYADGTLVEVAPSTDPETDTTYTVMECLDDLERTVTARRARART
jgi:hypothetical protein